MPVERISLRTTALEPEDVAGAYLSIPHEVLGQVTGKTKRVFLGGTINGHPFQATAVPYYGTHKVVLNKGLREQTGIRPGDQVVLECAVSTSPPRLAIDPDVEAALDSTPGARAAFDRLAHTHRREHLDAIAEAKRPETRAARIGKLLDRLQERGRAGGRTR